MNIQERILDLDRVKVQLIISWLSHQELIELIKSDGQDLEDYILDNISSDGRLILLEYLNLNESDYRQRLSVRKKINKFYLELMEKEDRALKGSERRAIKKKSIRMLSEDEIDIWKKQHRSKEKKLSGALRDEILGYLTRLDKGKGLSP